MLLEFIMLKTDEFKSNIQKERRVLADFDPYELFARVEAEASHEESLESIINPEPAIAPERATGPGLFVVPKIVVSH